MTSQTLRRLDAGTDAMSIRFTPVIPTRSRGHGRFAVRSADLSGLLPQVSPVVVMDDFRVSGHPFGPHPHAGFSAVTYVLEDSPGGLRSRDSLGGDVIVGPGGMVWTQAGRGAFHDEMPAEPGRELHGLQVFVNLSRAHKDVAPQVLYLDGPDVPEWRGEGGRVRVLMGSYDGVTSPLVAAEPFDWLDIDVRKNFAFALQEGRNALVYVLAGAVRVQADDAAQTVPTGHAIGLHGGAGQVIFEVGQGARFVLLSGKAIDEPVVSHGPFIMSSTAEVQDALERLRRGDMGRLAPLGAA